MSPRESEPMQKVVVTGAAGFIGSHVADYLESQGFEIIRSDVSVPKKGEGKWIRADLTLPENLVHLTRGVDAICHVGGIADVYVASKEPQLAMSVNAVGTLNLLEAAVRNNVRRFVHASTWEVYGAPQYEPVDEQHPCFPMHPYSISKFAGDLIVQSYGLHGPLKTVVLRLGTAYGPRMRQNAVIPAFILRAMRKETIEIHGTGEQLRQFTHVSDIARAVCFAVKQKAVENVYNIVSPEETSIRSLAETITSYFPTGIKYRESRPGDAPYARVSSELAKRSLGWTAEIPLRRGLEDLIRSGFITG